MHFLAFSNIFHSIKVLLLLLHVPYVQAATKVVVEAEKKKRDRKEAVLMAAAKARAKRRAAQSLATSTKLTSSRQQCSYLPYLYLNEILCPNSKFPVLLPPKSRKLVTM